MMATSCEGAQKQLYHAPPEPVIGCAISSGFGFILLASRVHAALLSATQSVLDAWKQIKEDMTFGDLTATMLSTDISQAGPIVAEITTLETQLTNLRNQRDTLYQGMWDKLKRVRAGVKANYGDDSSQYEMVGGTRLSERKSPTRKPTATG